MGKRGIKLVLIFSLKWLRMNLYSVCWCFVYLCTIIVLLLSMSSMSHYRTFYFNCNFFLDWNTVQDRLSTARYHTLTEFVQDCLDNIFVLINAIQEQIMVQRSLLHVRWLLSGHWLCRPQCGMTEIEGEIDRQRSYNISCNNSRASNNYHQAQKDDHRARVS